MAGMYPTNKEISSFGKTVKFPGVDESGKFTNGDFSNPDIPPSFLDANTVNLVIDNLNTLVAHLGGNANNTDGEQLKKLFSITAEANKAIKRDSEGRAKVAPPVEADDIARKAEIDAEAKARSDGDITVTTKLSNHTQSKQNPHGVTKAQVGLGNVDNTADVNKVVKESKTCSGNSATATKWQAARNINGLLVQGDADLTDYATCSTAAGTQAKVCGCSGFKLVTGAEITIKFNVTNTATAPTLNVNNTGAKSIYYRGAAIAAGYLAKDRTYTFRYNGNQYELVGDINTNTSYGEATTFAAGLMSATDKGRLNNNYITASNFGETSGYVKYSNGLIVQWGKAASPRTIPDIDGKTGYWINDNKYIQLPLEYSGNYSIFTQGEDAPRDKDDYVQENFLVHSKNSKGFHVTHWDSYDGWGNAVWRCNWLTIGI